MPPKKPAPPQSDARPTTLKHNPFAALSGVPPRADERPAGAATPPEHPPATAEPAEPAPLSAKITVRRETGGRGGKTVTRVLGLPPERLDELASRMKKALGCGAVIEGADVVLLGSLVPRAAAWLRAEGAKRVVEGN